MRKPDLTWTFLVTLGIVTFLGSICHSSTAPELLDFIGTWQSATSSIRKDPNIWQQYVEYHKKVWKSSAVSEIPFTCERETSTSPPTSVHKLRPGDIKVVAAIGDSLTAASALDASSLAGTMLAFRGESWSMGGDFSLDEGVITLPNILRKFNPELKGQSTCIRFRGHEDTWLNVAVPGSFAGNMPNQADVLIQRMKSDWRIDFQNDWKLITFLIGGNDLCRYCMRESEGRFTPDKYLANVRATLDKFHLHVPKALVSFVQMLDISFVRNMSDINPWCYNFHRVACNCALREPEVSRQTQREYTTKIEELVASGVYDTKDDFSVVIQPHLSDAPPPIDPETGKIDASFIAPDCFHPNRKGHQELAFALWNVMLMPLEDKPKTYTSGQFGGYKCPTKEYPYIFTNLNSDPVPTSTPPTATGYANLTPINLICSLLLLVMLNI